MPNHKVFKGLPLPYFARIVRDGDAITAMTFYRNHGLEGVLADMAKRIETGKAAHAAYEALPEDQRGADNPLPPPIAVLEPWMVPLTGEAAVAALSSVGLETSDPGLNFEASSIGAAEGIWTSVQWDTYRHGDAAFGKADAVHEYLLTVDTEGYVYAPFDRLAGLRKDERAGQDLRRMERSILVSVSVPYPGAALDDCAIVVNVSPEAGHFTNMTLGEATPELMASGDKDSMPKLSVFAKKKVPPGEKTDIDIVLVLAGKASPVSIPVLVETDMGYLSHRRVMMTGGGRLSFRALDIYDGVATISAMVEGNPNSLVTTTIEIAP